MMAICSALSLRNTSLYSVAVVVYFSEMVGMSACGRIVLSANNGLTLCSSSNVVFSSEKYFKERAAWFVPDNRRQECTLISSK